jgi:hypothetical protein
VLYLLKELHINLLKMFKQVQLTFQGQNLVLRGDNITKKFIIGYCT